MKCVCPMGGDRTCPDNCLIAVWHSTPPDQRTKERRRPLVEQLAKQGYTQQAIGMQLGVDQRTVGRDLETLGILPNIKGKHKDKLGRKGNTGRPKGSKSRAGPKPERRTVSSNVDAIAASLVLDQGLTYEQAQHQLGLDSVQPVKTAVAREEGRRDPQVDREQLSFTAQQKLDAAIRQYKAKLDAEFEVRTREDCRRWLNEIGLPQYAKELAVLEQSITSRRGIMDRITYRKILACLHPDRVTDPMLKKRYEEAFLLFTKLEKRVLDEKESPTQFRKMPRTYEDLMAMKAKVQAERRAKRTAGQSTLRSR